jgi:hypothetical protein
MHGTVLPIYFLLDTNHFVYIFQRCAYTRVRHITRARDGKMAVISTASVMME